jgi:hypothetical protein
MRMAATSSRHASVITALPAMITTTERGVRLRGGVDQLLVLGVQGQRVPVTAVGTGVPGGGEFAAAAGAP